MKISFKKLKTADNTIRVSFDNKNTFENYNKNTALVDGITIPNECTDFSNIVVKTDRSEISDLVYEIPTDLLNSGNLSSKLDKRIKKVKIPDGVTSIVRNAFRNCSNLTSIEIPDSVTSIRDEAFRECISLTNINIPKSITSIVYGAFSHCISLTNIEIPESVTSISEGAFYNCSSLTNIEIPNSVTFIDSSAFGNCTNLKSIIVRQNFDQTILEGKIPSGAQIMVLITQEDLDKGEDYLQEFTQNNSVCKIADGVTSISSGTFLNCIGLTSIAIPKGVTSIGECAFMDCNRLTSINIPEGVTSISTGTFDGCYGLTSIEIPESVTSIGSNAFSRCSSLASINIPDGVTSIGKNAFYRCEGLTVINYRGAEEQWNNIDKTDGWNTNCPAVINYNYVG